MLYEVLKIYVRLVMPLYCNSIVVNRKKVLAGAGPLLIASNHPNSFLDAIIFDVLFNIPVWSLTRGDAFESKTAAVILKHLKMLPVYRLREGAENLNNNYNTFDYCMEIFNRNEGVLIFCEGQCINEWHLRPLKKGTARLAFKAWNKKLPLKILPVGINYSSFRKYGKRIIINFGDFLEPGQFEMAITDGEKNTQFNKLLQNQLQHLVFEIDKDNHDELENKFGKTHTVIKWLLAVPAFVGSVLHLPLYSSAKIFTKLFFDKTDHYDSVMFGFLLLTYPLYIVILAILVSLLTSPIYALAIIFAVPFCAWCCAKYDVRKG